MNFQAMKGAAARTDPYPYMIAGGVLAREAVQAVNRDFPDIREPGFFPSTQVPRKGAFDALLKELEGPEIAEILGNKLGIDLSGKPRLITIRKWSAKKDGRIHNDSLSKICTSLVYLNETWPEEDGGRLCVLRDGKSFDSAVEKVEPSAGTFFAFKRTANSWHGHKPFVGERRVVQITWLQSEEDLKRKEKRGALSHFLKKIMPGAHGGY